MKNAMNGKSEQITRDAATPCGVVIPGLDIKKAKRYSRARLAALALSTAATLAETAWFAFSGKSHDLRKATRALTPGRALDTATYAAGVVGGTWLAGLPVGYVGGYRIERRFGLTKQSSSGWLADRLKGFGLELVMEPALVAATFAVIRRRPRDWWLVLSGAAIPLAVVLGNLAPVLIMPLFNRFEPLNDPELEHRIRALGERAGVHIADIYRMDMSRQTEKANAFFTGLGNTKRIVLGDTLLNGSTPEEIEAVVAHELGHQVHGDMWRFVASGSLSVLAITYGLSRIAPWAIARTSALTGVTSLKDEASLPVLGLVAGLIGAVVGPLNAAYSRNIEGRTDQFALDLTQNGPVYARMMERLAAQNLSDPCPPKLLVWLMYSHPPTVDRIARARNFQPNGVDLATN
ncbi:MAG TPA: M48 family metallopeptidase [Thermomicrobiales bacterium]|nr:M48 family metallopeptidase [Thermomicrobiales bacterium]